MRCVWARTRQPIQSLNQDQVRLGIDGAQIEENVIIFNPSYDGRFAMSQGSQKLCGMKGPVP